MENRMYFGVDLNVNYADLIRSEADMKKKQRLIEERNFKLGCLIREKEYIEGMLVVDRNMQGWQIASIEGTCIENMQFLVKDQAGNMKAVAPVEVVDFAEIRLDSDMLALQYAICSAVGLKSELPKIKRPYWFDLVDKISVRRSCDGDSV